MYGSNFDPPLPDEWIEPRSSAEVFSQKDMVMQDFFYAHQAPLALRLRVTRSLCRAASSSEIFF